MVISLYPKFRKCVLYSDWSQFDRQSLLVTHLAPKHWHLTSCCFEFRVHFVQVLSVHARLLKTNKYFIPVGYWNFVMFRMSELPGHYSHQPHGHPGQHPPPHPDQVFPQVSISVTCLLVLQKMKVVLSLKVTLVFFSRGLYSSCI